MITNTITSITAALTSTSLITSHSITSANPPTASHGPSSLGIALRTRRYPSTAHLSGTLIQRAPAVSPLIQVVYLVFIEVADGISVVFGGGGSGGGGGLVIRNLGIRG